MSNLLWIDLETTGLEPDQHVILEVAAVVTTWDLEELGQYETTIDHDPQDPRELCDPYVFKMHTNNGLFTACAEIGIPLENAQEELLEFLDSLDVLGSPCAGSTPQFDRSFLREYMPLVDKVFNHRVLDVSTMKAWQAAHGVEFPKFPSTHRAMPDIHGSIKLLRFMRGQAIR